MSAARIAMAAALALIVLVGVLVLTLPVRVYDGLNKGLTVGDCGVEIVGVPGFFCGDY